MITDHDCVLMPQSQILCVGYAADGSSFASGGEDGRVIVWAPQVT